MPQSAFNPSGNQPLRTGLNAHLGPTGISHSKMPEHLVDGKVEEEDDRKLDCNGTDAGEALCEIENALKGQNAGRASRKEPTGGELPCRLGEIPNPD